MQGTRETKSSFATVIAVRLYFVSVPAGDRDEGESSTPFKPVGQLVGHAISHLESEPKEKHGMNAHAVAR